MRTSSTKDPIGKFEVKGSKDSTGGSVLNATPSRIQGKGNVSPCPPSEKQVDRTTVSTLMTMEKNSEFTGGVSLSSKTVRVLQKKITKTLTMMNEAEHNEKKGRDSKLYRRLVEKLQQYEIEITEMEETARQAEQQQQQFTKKETNAGPPVSPKKTEEMQVLGDNIPAPMDTQEYLSKKKLEPQDNFQLIPPTPPATPDTSHDRPIMLKKKMEKVDKLMAEMVMEHGHKAKSKKIYKKYEEKRVEYEMALKEFEARMKLQASKGHMVTLSPFSTSIEEQDAPETTWTKFGMSVGKADTTLPQSTTEVATRKKKSKRDRKPKKTKGVSAARIQELGEEFQPKSHEKDEVAEELIRQALKSNFVFGKFSDRSVETLVKAFEPTKIYTPGELIIQQGEEIEPIYFFIIRSGEVAYEVNCDKVGIAGPGKSFGEQGLLYSCKRKASVRAISPTQLFRVDQITYRYLLQNQTKFHKAWKQAMRTIMAMNRLLGAAALAQKFSDDSDHSSTASREKDSDDDSERSINLGKLDDEDGKVVGETSGEINYHRSSVRYSFKESQVGLDNFVRTSVLGEGQYGEVWMVKPTNIKGLKDQNFALKIQAKANMNRDSTPGMTITVAEAIKRECEVLAQFCHPFICEFVHMFEDEQNIYMVMGIIRGIELWNIIHRENDDGDWDSGISEDNAKFYCALIADTLRYMHRRKVCYRDLKPENIMVNEKGYPIFVDFGFAKHIPNGTTYTFCGTPRYTCPEIIGNQGHGFPVDWWAFGVVIFEMISGENPFYYDGIAEMQLLEDIVHNDPESLGEDFSADVKDLVSKLLIKDPFTRLGTLNPNDVLKHPWLASIDLVKGRDQLLEPPFLPLALQD